MDIYILNDKFDMVDIIDDYKYLMWDMAFYKSGFFEMRADIRHLTALTTGRYVYRNDSNYTGRIDTVAIDGQIVTISGRFLESLLDFRVDALGRTHTDPVETAMINILRDNSEGNRAIQGLEIKAGLGRGATGTFTAFGKSIAEYFYELAEAYDLSFNVKYNQDAKSMTFNVIDGIDRTQFQTVNSWCIFSRDFDNVMDEYFEMNTDYANFAYVFGENSASVIIDKSRSGERREIFVDASDLRREEGMSEAVYTALLRQRGYEKLAEAGRFETVGFTVTKDHSMPFGLGDIVTYKQPNLNKTYDLRVTEIREIHEKGNIKRNIVLGKNKPGVVQTIRKGAM